MRGLGGGGRRSSLQPPPFTPTLALSHKFRFVSGGNSGTFGITRKNLLNLVVMANSTTTTVRLFEAIRLKNVEIWGNPSALGSAPVTLQLEWLGENSPSTVVSDTSMGVRPAHVSSSPPPSSSNRWWSISGTSESDVLFNMTVPTDCVIDVTTELRFVEQEAPTAGEAAVAATSGQVYGDYLDGIVTGVGSSSLAPVGYVVLP
jgi:hypothetical protein